jgi:ABC-type antimicrobial peptide transport system permease subunit
MTIMLLMVVVILGFGVSNALLISVTDRYRYFSVLKAIGVPPFHVGFMIVFEAFLLCLAAGLLGTILGVAVSEIWGKIGLDLSQYTSYNPHFSVDPVIYPRITLAMTLSPQALALLAGAISALWPAMVAGRKRVASGMRDL